MTTSPAADHPTTEPAEDAGTLLLVLLHTTLSDPRTYTALNFGAAGQFKSVNFSHGLNGERILNQLEIETTTARFFIGIDQIPQ